MPDMLSSDLLESLNLRALRSGKVRDLYEYHPTDGRPELWLVSSDRVSAFDQIIKPDIPEKGKILTQMARHWFEMTPRVHNHVLSYHLPEAVVQALPDWRGRTVRCQRLDIIPIECVVRGYLAGSGWKQYQKTGEVCGIPLPTGLGECERLPELLFTPTTKAEEGHDLPLTPAQARELVGAVTYQELSRISRELFAFAQEYAARRGIIIADTKFEFGRNPQGHLVLADEIFTPDSSRFWPRDQYEPGRPQPSFDKQIVRDYLEQSGWDKKPPVPTLPANIVEKTRAKYLEGLHRLAGTIELSLV